MMLFKPFAFVATAAAFLIVPETSEADDGIFRALPIEPDVSEAVSVSTLGQVVDVPCQQCRGRDSHLELNFSINERRLMLNGFELYPHADPWNSDLSAAVIKGNGKSTVRRLGYGLSIRSEGKDEDQQLEVLGIDVKIIEVGDRFVDGVPPVNVKLIKNPAGELIIGVIDVATPGNKTQEGCRTMWCRAKGAMHNTLSGLKTGFKGCKGHGHHGHHHGYKNHGGLEAAMHESGAHPHGHHNDLVQKPNRSWSAMLKHVTAYIIIPVLMGITAGIGVALFAMCICTLTVRLVRFFKGESNEVALGAAHKAAIVEITVDDEKFGLMSNDDQNPHFEDEYTEPRD